jgi:hypothetical protein
MEYERQLCTENNLIAKELLILYSVTLIQNTVSFEYEKKFFNFNNFQIIRLSIYVVFMSSNREKNRKNEFHGLICILLSGYDLKDLQFVPVEIFFKS